MPEHVRNLRRVRRIHVEAGGDDAETLARMFEDDGIPDDGSVEGRLRALLEATEHRWIPWTHTFLDVPGLHEAKGFSDRGFRPEFQDPWPVSRDQIGHILTAVALALNARRLAKTRFGIRVRDLVGAPKDMSNDEVALRLTIGHEKLPDPGRFDPLILWKLRRQFACVTDADVVTFGDALAALGSDTGLDLNRAGQHLAEIAVGDRVGNSIQDLNLSLAGYRLAQLVRDGRFAHREEFAAWVRENLKGGEA